MVSVVEKWFRHTEPVYRSKKQIQIGRRESNRVKLWLVRLPPCPALLSDMTQDQSLSIKPVASLEGTRPC